jgi:SAM-dependent methyltransferase
VSGAVGAVERAASRLAARHHRPMIWYPYTNSSPSAPAVRRMLERAYPAAREASLVVHPDDDMYAFGIAVIGSETLSAMAYFRAGASMMDVIERVAEWHFGSLSKVSSLLDFAGGYGRSTRFAVEYLSPDRVTVGEIQADALAFQAREFGVSTLQSTRDPAALPTPRTFDFIFVASLFTHLPRATFGPWLAKLWELVAPGGVLVFSVHDEVLDRQDADWEDGFAFLAASEVAALDTEQYGTNFTTEAFVRAQLEEWIGDDALDAVRLPQGLCFQQDLWVVTRGPHSQKPLVYENGPNGALDWLEADGRDFLLSGWVGDTGFAEPDAASHRITRVEVSLTDGTTVDADLALPRPEIAVHLGRPGDALLEASGWAVRGRAGRRLRLGDVVTVTAICEHRGRFVLDSTRVVDMLTRTGGTLPPAPLERRLETARTVLRYRGLAGLVELVPTVARNEWRRLGRRLRTASRGVQ